MALGLLTVLIRHQDGWMIRLDEIGKKYGYGRDAMSYAMGALQVARYVVKVRIMSASERQWSTEVVVYDTPATDEELGELLASIEGEPDVRVVQVIDPTAAAVDRAAQRREKLGIKPRKATHTFSVPPKSSGAADSRRGQGGNDSTKSALPKKQRKAAAPQGLRMSQKQAASVRAVEEAFPPILRELLPSYRPPVLRDAILDALESRSADVLVARVQRRWREHGYEAAAAPGGKGIGSAVGVAIGLVRPSTDCPEPMCEDGVVLDSGSPCRACEQRRADRKAVHGNSVPGQRDQGEAGSAPARWRCTGCKTLGLGEGPEDGLCRVCRQEAEDAAAATRRLQERLAAEEAQRSRLAAENWSVMVEEAYLEHAERERAAADRRATAEEAVRRREADAEATRLLREQIAQENPELAAYAQHAS
ncbi:hypothetical protein ACFYWP_37255 [Actinacidiphila glaucinigra]|uniref:hypothetical protein n=1 Tax=Actinacidiphila glaucinigra TaxID=235986 RepID=UPI003675AEC2